MSLIGDWSSMESADFEARGVAAAFGVAGFEAAGVAAGVAGGRGFEVVVSLRA